MVDGPAGSKDAGIVYSRNMRGLWIAGASLVAIALCAGCGGGSARPSVSIADSARFVPRNQGVLGAGLLTLADVDAATGGGGAFKQVSLESASAAQNPDPRGPCGTPIDQPDFQSGAATAFQAPGGTVFSYVADLPGDVVDRWFLAMHRDERPGCPDWSSHTPYGYDQQNHHVGEVLLPAFGDDRLADVTRVTTPAGRPAYASGIIIRHGTYVTVVIVLSGRTLPPSMVTDLAQRADRALTRLGS